MRDLSAGISVVADRYAFSGIAFSAAKVGSTGRASRAHVELTNLRVCHSGSA